MSVQEIVAWILATLVSVGGLIAGARKWLLRQKKQHEDAAGMSYKVLFADLKKDLQTVNTGFKKLQEDHAACQVKLARLEERVSYLEQENDTLKGNPS